MELKRGPWTIKGSAEKYRNELMTVTEDEVIRPDGKPGTYGTVRMKAGVSILPLDDDGFVYLTSQFRYCVGRESVETASGAIDEGEEAEEAALRELREELGIEAGKLISLGGMDLDTSIVNCPVELFLARDLKFTAPQREGTEDIKTVKLKFDEAYRMVIEGEIRHSPSCVLILKAHNYLDRQEK